MEDLRTAPGRVPAVASPVAARDSSSTSGTRLIPESEMPSGGAMRGTPPIPDGQTMPRWSPRTGHSAVMRSPMRSDLFLDAFDSTMSIPWSGPHPGTSPTTP